MKNLRQYLKIIYCRFPLIFLLGAIFYPFVANLFFSNTALLDNRALKTKPQKFTSHFSQDFTDYYNDTFAGREKLIVKYIKLQQKLQLDTGQYFYGQKGWMFYDSIKVNNGNTILDYLGNVFLENDELEKLKTALEKEKSFYEQNGAKYLLMVVPNKENVYAEYMPERLQKLRKSDFSLSDAGMKYLQDNTTIQVLNLKPILLAAKKNYQYPLYYRKDTHWNSLGGYIGFEALIKSFNEMGLGGKVQSLLPEMISEAGLVGQDMHPTDKDMSYQVAFLSEKAYTKTEVVANRIIVYDNQNPLSNETILVVGDSFAGGFLPYLAKVYLRVVNIPAGVKDLSFYQDIMTEYKPNLVVHELAERYFSRLTNLGKLYEGKK